MEKVMMDLSILKKSGWNTLQPSNQQLVDGNSKQRCIPCDTALRQKI